MLQASNPQNSGNRNNNNKKKRGLRFDDGVSSSSDEDDGGNETDVLDGTDEEREFIDAEISSEDERDDPSLAVFVGKSFSRSGRKSNKKAKTSKSASPSSSGGSAAKKKKSGEKDKHALHPHNHPNDRPRYACSHFAKSTVDEAELASPCEKCVDKFSSPSSHKTNSKPKSSSSSGTAPASSSSSSKYAQLSFTGSGESLPPVSINGKETFDEGMERRLREVYRYARSFSPDHDARLKALQDKVKGKDSEIAKVKADNARAIAAKDAALSTMRKRAQDAESKVAQLKADLENKGKDMDNFVSVVVDSLHDVGEKLSCPLTLTLFGDDYPAALLSNDGIAYVKRDYRNHIIETEEPLPVDTANVPIVSIRGYNSMVTGSDHEGSHMGRMTRFYRHSYTGQRIHISEEGVKDFTTLTKAGQSVVDFVKRVRDTGLIKDEVVKDLEGMVPEVVRYRWQGNRLGSTADVRKALGVDNNTPVASMTLVDMWKESFTTPITRSTVLPSGSWKNVNGRTELESIDPDLFRAHNRSLKQLTENHCEPHFASQVGMAQPMAQPQPPVEIDDE